MTIANFIKTITVIDPDSNADVDVCIYKEQTGGGMFGVDASYVEQEIGEVISPHGNGELELIDPENCR